MLEHRSSTPLADPHALVTRIVSDQRFIGDLAVGGQVIIEGQFLGSLEHPDTLLIASGGRVQGEVNAREVIVAGELRGTVHADERLEVRVGGVVVGDVAAPRLVCADGGIVDGTLRMADPISMTTADAVARSVAPSTSSSSAPLTVGAPHIPHIPHVASGEGLPRARQATPPTPDVEFAPHDTARWRDAIPAEIVSVTAEAPADSAPEPSSARPPLLDGLTTRTVVFSLA